MNAPIRFTLTLTAPEVLSLLNAVDTYHAGLLRERLEDGGPETLSEARARRVREALDAVAVPAALAQFEAVS